MKIELVNDFGLCQELPLRSMTHSISMYMSYIKLSVDYEIIKEINVNSEAIIYENKDNTIIIPCLFTIENTCTIEINYDNEKVKYIFKYDKSIAIDNKVIESLGDFHRRTSEWIGKRRIKVDELIHGIDSGRISLLHILDPLTGLDNENFLSEIRNAIPFALNICTTPRQHLKVEDEILDVELVKRISPASLQHLSSHSEHWRGRTITGLVPSRMLAQVYEDDINIYENTFFRMAIEKILLYVSEKDSDVKKALAQKNSYIDWEQYGNMLSDYKRGELLRKLLPEYDYDEEDFRREQFKELISTLENLEKGLSSILSTSFYQGINRFKNIQLPVQPTNIIKMDNRYNEIFKLWNKLLTLKAKDNSEVDLTGATIKDINNYYLLYVQILLIYGLSILGLKYSNDSYLGILDDGLCVMDVCFENDNFDIKCNTEKSEHIKKIKINIIEKVNKKIKFPPICELNNEIHMFKEICEIDPSDSSYIIFKKKPSLEHEKQLNSIFKKNKKNIKELTQESIRKFDRMDREWRKFLGDVMINLREPRSLCIYVYPILASVGNDEIDLKKNTQILLNGIDTTCLEDEKVSNIFALPIDLYKFDKVESDDLISRIINYGEAYGTTDAIRLGNYRSGIVPISQTEINSTQRLIKLVSIHLNRLAIEWGIAKNNCPLCQTADILKVDSSTWKCKNHECGVLWGTTRCSNGCGEEFCWIRPSVEFSKLDIEETNPLKLKLKKESIFDRLTITDFDFKQENGTIKYVPKCPKCGSSSSIEK